MNTCRSLVRGTALLAPVMLLPACVSGTVQAVAVSTSPPGATCAVDRAGARLAVIAQTPGILRVNTSGNELTVTCSKAGFQTAIANARPGAAYLYPPDIRLQLAGNPGYGPAPIIGYDPRAGYPVDRYRPPANVLPDPVGSHAASY